jgi:hypothetical protein
MAQIKETKPSGNLGREIQKAISGDPMRNWRSWGSWYSWGSATGLGLFFVLTAFAVWICFHL